MIKNAVRVMMGLFVVAFGMAGCGGGGSSSGGTDNGGSGGGVGGTVTHSYINTTVGNTRTYNNGMTETVLSKEVALLQWKMLMGHTSNRIPSHDG